MFQTACFVLFLQLIQTGIFDAFHYTGRLNVFVHEPTGCGQAGYFAAKEKGRLKCFQTACCVCVQSVFTGLRLIRPGIRGILSPLYRRA